MKRSLLTFLTASILLSGCAAEQPPVAVMTPDPAVIAVAPFNQPFRDEQLLAGYIPHLPGEAAPEVLQQLDEAYKKQLAKSGRDLVWLKRSDIDTSLKEDSHGRKNALATWAQLARKAGAGFIIVPQVLSWYERMGDETAVTKSAQVAFDIYLIDARSEVQDGALLARSHYTEDPSASLPLDAEPSSVSARACLTASDFAEEAMMQSIHDFKF